MSQRQANRDCRQSQISAAGEAEQDAQAVDDDEARGSQPHVAIRPVHRDGAPNGDYGHQEESDCVGRVVDHDGRRVDDVILVMAQGVGDDGRVGHSGDGRCERKSAQDEQCAIWCRDDIDKHEAERDRLHQVSTVKTKRRPVVRRHHDRDCARDQENNRRHGDCCAPVGKGALAYRLDDEGRDRDQNRVFQNRRRQWADVPANRIEGRRCASCGGQTGAERVAGGRCRC